MPPSDRPPRDDPRGPVSQILRRAGSHGAPNVERLVAAVPSMLAEAARRRRAVAPGSRLDAVARVWLPGLALATAALVLAALLWPARSPGRGAEAAETVSLERWLVTGSAPARVSDPVLDALVRRD